MVYATQLDVEGKCTGLMQAIGNGGKFTESTTPKASQVLTWISDTESEVNQYLKSAGCNAPYTTGTEQAKALKRTVLLNVVASVYEAYGRHAGNSDELEVNDYLTRYQSILDDISDNPDKWVKLLDGTTVGKSVRSHPNTGNNRIYKPSKDGILW